MEVSKRTLAVSAGMAAAGVAVTQQAAIGVTWPVVIGPELMKAILPIVLAVVPVLLQQFAPGLLPIWERLKSLFLPNAEAADYAALSRVAAIKPDCPVWQGHCRELSSQVYEKHHPTPATVPSAGAKGGAA